MEENSDGDLRNLGLIGKHMPQAQHCFRAFFSFFVKNITGLVRVLMRAIQLLTVIIA
jgi:hypothetical protein